MNEMRSVLSHDFLEGRRVSRIGFPSSNANTRDCLAPLEQSSNHRLKSCGFRKWQRIYASTFHKIRLLSFFQPWLETLVKLCLGIHSDSKPPLQVNLAPNPSITSQAQPWRNDTSLSIVEPSSKPRTLSSPMSSAAAVKNNRSRFDVKRERKILQSEEAFSERMDKLVWEDWLRKIVMMRLAT